MLLALKQSRSVGKLAERGFATGTASPRRATLLIHDTLRGVPSRHHARGLATQTTSAVDDRPLAGIRVLDLSTAIAGPSCAMYLGDLGAEVIKLEVPKKGDDTRGLGPFLKYKDGGRPQFAPHMEREGSYYLAVNRNKRSLTLNLKTAKGIAIAKELLKTTDVLIENQVTGKLAKLGLGYEDVRVIKPDIVYCSITGYGQDGPFRTSPGYDAVVGCEAGLVYATGEPGRSPVKPGGTVTDFNTGFSAVKAILASLFARQRTGKGAYLDISMFDVQVCGALTWR
jgi:succinate--hydroxymethylglutarate CoA-transferase